MAPKRFRRQLKQYPRIRFVDPLVFELHEGAGLASGPSMTKWLLVEPLIEGSYQKYNNNMGAVVDEGGDMFSGRDSQDDSKEQQAEVSRTQEMMFMSRNDLRLSSDLVIGSQLKAIDEGSEGDDDEERDWCIDRDLLKIQSQGSNVEKPEGEFSDVHDMMFPQAFTHFTYVKSKKNLMVVDLQGSLQVASDGKREFVLTDPAIHKGKREDGEITAQFPMTVFCGRSTLEEQIKAPRECKRSLRPIDATTSAEC